MNRNRDRVLLIKEVAMAASAVFLANNLCFAGLAALSVQSREATLNNVQLMPVNVADFAWVYLPAAAITLVVFAVIRRKGA